MKRFFLLVCLALASNVLADGGAPREYDWAPLFSRRVTASGDLQFRALGPLLERTTSPEGQRYRAARPFFAQVNDPLSGTMFRDVVWPIAIAKRVRHLARWRFLLAYSYNHDVTDPYSKRRFWVLPVYFEGRTDEQQRYFALFPLGGSIHDFFYMDRIQFALWPLYTRSNVGPVVTRSYLWPIVSRTKGHGIERFRVFPFYGRSQFRDRYIKKFVLWPFWTSAVYNYTEKQSGKAYILFPLVGHMRLENQNTWWVLPPFFRVTRGERQNLTYAPWPLYQRGTGEYEKIYLWPFFGSKRSQAIKEKFYLWPFAKATTIDRVTSTVRRKRVWPFVFWGHERPRKPDGPKASSRTASYAKVWPLFSTRTRGGETRTQVLELWPSRNNPRPVARSWSAIWTLWHKQTVGDRVDSDWLWGWYSHARRGGEVNRWSLFPLVDWRRDDRVEETREWNVLKGLVGYRREGTRRSLRLLYFRFGGEPKQP